MIAGRTHSRDRSRGHGAGLWTPLALGASLAGWYTAKAGLTVTGGKVSAWADQGPLARHLTQGTGAAQPAYSASSASWGSRPAITYAGAQSLVAAVASDWNFLHDGTGASLFLVGRRTGTGTAYIPLSTTSISAANLPGFAWIAYGTTNNFLGLAVQDNSGTRVIDVNTAANTLPVNTNSILAYQYLEGRTPDEYLERITGAQVKNGNSAIAPSALDATTPLTIGRAATFPFEGDINEVVVCDRFLTTSELQLLERYLAGEWGIALP